MWEKPKVVRIKRRTSPVQIMINKTPGECGILHKMHLGFQSEITIIVY
jgi:hypothetical protein